MGLAKERRILSIIIAVIVAAATALLLYATVISLTLGNEEYIRKRVITGGLAQECEAQLDASFLTLESETGIPIRVFQQVKKDFPVGETLVRVYQGQYSEEGSTLYSKNMVDYFYKLCADYLKGNDIAFKKNQVYRAAEKAAKLFSDAMGMQNADGMDVKLSNIKGKGNRYTLLCSIVIILCMLMIAYLYGSKSKPSAYLAAGFAAGGMGTLLSVILLLVFKAPSKLLITPPVYAAAYQGLLRSYLGTVLLVSLAVFVIAYGVLISAEKKIYKSSLK